MPALVMGLAGQLQAGVTMSLGAVCASISDMPGPVTHKRNGMLAATALAMLAALLTGFARLHVITLGLEILVCSFLFSMLMVYGVRASVVGLGGLLILVLTMDRDISIEKVLPYAGLVLAGGLWYTVLSLLTNRIFPYRAGQQALGDSIREVAAFLRLKADFYRPHTNLDDNYRTLITQQIQVSEKQDAVRELLFKSRMVVKESTQTGRTLLKTFINLVDLYEQITTIYYDYASLRNRFAATGLLDQVAQLIVQLANEVEAIGFAVQANYRPSNRADFTAQLEKLKIEVDFITAQEPENSTLVLKKILVNLRSIAQRITDISLYLNQNEVHLQDKGEKLEFGKFVSRQNLDPKIFVSNLSWNSSIFRFSVRMALVATFTFFITQLFPYGQHNYWVLLTVVFILKPSFGLTKQRNYGRILGTLVGGVIGLLILYLVPGDTGRFVCMLLFMTAFYTVQRTNYALSVIFMTPFMLLLFGFLGDGGLGIVQERIIDTVAGCAIAFLATYLIFPNWETKKIGGFLEGVLRANLQYLQVITEELAGREVSRLQYKLARKEVYVASANLSAAFRRMTAEPKHKQRNSSKVYALVVLNHLLSSYLANIASDIEQQDSVSFFASSQKSLRRSANSLAEALRNLAPDTPVENPFANATEGESIESTSVTSENDLLREQLEFIQKVCADITKSTAAL